MRRDLGTAGADDVTTTPLDQLVDRWREKAASLEGYSDAAAKAFVEAAADLERALNQAEAVLLTLSEAGRRTGYSPDHIARLVRQRVVPNHGTKGRPRVRLADLPRKAPALATRGTKSYDLDADARALLAARKAPK